MTYELSSVPVPSYPGMMTLDYYYYPELYCDVYMDYDEFYASEADIDAFVSRDHQVTVSLVSPNGLTLSSSAQSFKVTLETPCQTATMDLSS